MQIILKDSECRELQRAARSRHISISEWVLQALALARQREPVGAAGRKLEAIRAAARFDHPAADIDRMLEEIEAGYWSGARP
ncbi:MAG TPA: antitoxin [Terriglobia bacterium]|nr:antitoxin [Terriglobia bacterium]